MSPSRTQTSCPNCRQPIVVEVERLFDLNKDPQAKQKILSGAFNLFQCPHCGANGQLPTPIVYHDPEKELLLTHVPPQLGLAMDQQEQVIGPMINQIVSRLPQEKRKAYLLQPKAMLSLQSLIETILEGDGITKEMIEEQQKRLRLIQRLVNTTTPEALETVCKEEDASIDVEFFNLFNHLIESALASGDKATAQRMVETQQKIMAVTTFGQKLKEQTDELEAAISSLKELGENLTRDNLVDLVVKAPNKSRVQALVSLARNGMDYQFFQILSNRIDRARGDGRKRLVDLREKLLALTAEYDQQVEAQFTQSRQDLEKLLQAENVREALIQNLNVVNDFFFQVLQVELETARKSGDLDRAAKLQTIVSTLDEISAPPPESAFINELLEVPDEAAREKLLEARSEEVTPALVSTLTNLLGQSGGSSENEELANRLREVYRQVLRFSMAASLKK